MTFARRFALCGYQTVACGKLHHTGIDQMQGWLRRCGGNVAVDPDLVTGRVNPMPVPMELKWPQDKESGARDPAALHWRRRTSTPCGARSTDCDLAG
ncbi:hypothetical protein OG698_08310 [Streptomyces sp. NBC_01003]|uniref:hypothetical protein n=1 Tax=Streptomyces sp. NBC_01003 TaxID=2903714 RepID=UPI0038707CA0|nr:hypothetical protein OG698_08310 [Streptomyces sp. NBC_01003]